MIEFENWCGLRGLKPVPTSPPTVAKFIRDIGHMGIDRVWEIVQQISRAHYTIGLTCPCSGPGLVSDEINRISGIQPPRSWSDALKARFMTLPYDIQSEIARREKERDKAVSRAQIEAAELRNILKEHDAKIAA